MRTVIYSMGVSLDCYIAGPGGNDWGTPDAELHRFHNQQTSELGLHLLGRRLVVAMVSTSDSLLTDLLHQRCVMRAERGVGEGGGAAGHS